MMLNAGASEFVPGQLLLEDLPASELRYNCQDLAYAPWPEEQQPLLSVQYPLQAPLVSHQQSPDTQHHFPWEWRAPGSEFIYDPTPIQLSECWPCDETGKHEAQCSFRGSLNPPLAVWVQTCIGEQPQLCLRCTPDDGSDGLLLEAPILMQEIFGSDDFIAVQTEEVVDVAILGPMSASIGPRFGMQARRAFATSGTYTGWNAHGTGSSPKLAEDAARLALAVFVAAHIPCVARRVMLDRQGLARMAKLVECVAQSKALLTVGPWTCQVAVPHDALVPAVPQPEDTDDPNEDQATVEIVKHGVEREPQPDIPVQFTFDNAFKLNDVQASGSSTLDMKTPWVALDAAKSIAPHDACNQNALLAKLLSSTSTSADPSEDLVAASTVNFEAPQSMCPRPAPAVNPPPIIRCAKVVPPRAECPSSQSEAELDGHEFDGHELSKTPTPPRPLPPFLRAPTLAPPPRPPALAPVVLPVPSLDVGPWSPLTASGANASGAETPGRVRAPKAPAEPTAPAEHSAEWDLSAMSAAASAPSAVSSSSALTGDGTDIRELYDGVPQECLDDPYMELRRWDSGQKLWPYCTLCYCWSDKGHLAGAKHIKRVQTAEYYDPDRAFSASPLTIPATAVPVTSWTTPAVVERRAPRKPTSEEVREWHLPFVSFEWAALEEA